MATMSGKPEQIVESDMQIIANRKSSDEGELRHAWLKKHQNASLLVCDSETGVPHQAIYEYPASTLAQKEWTREFFAAVREEKERQDF